MERFDVSASDEHFEVWNNSDGRDRVEFWTNGDWIRVGRDVTDPSMCVTFRYEDEYYDEFRYSSHPLKISIADESGSAETYVIDQEGNAIYYFYKRGELVLQVNGRELSLIRGAYRNARYVREGEYEWSDYAESHVQSLFPSSPALEIASLKVSSNTPTGSVEVIHMHPCIQLNEGFIENVKSSPHTTWVGVYNNAITGDYEEYNGFIYKFKVDSRSIKNAENNES